MTSIGITMETGRGTRFSVDREYPSARRAPGGGGVAYGISDEGLLARAVRDIIAGASLNPLDVLNEMHRALAVTTKSTTRPEEGES
jgi:hypothetical protein